MGTQQEVPPPTTVAYLRATRRTLKKRRFETISYIFLKKVSLMFWEIELSSPKLRILLLFQEGTWKAQKTNISYISLKKVLSHCSLAKVLSQNDY